jgi:hypothetical protein
MFHNYFFELTQKQSGALFKPPMTLILLKKPGIHLIIANGWKKEGG